jgi:hypothetical protein
MKMFNILSGFVFALTFGQPSLWATVKFDLLGGLSPNKEFKVIVEEIDSTEKNKTTIVYKLLNIKTGITLLSIQSSYQPDVGAPGWGLENAKGAEIHWNNSCTKLAIDEENHRYIGKLFVVAIISANEAKNVSLPEKLKISREDRKWDRYRVRVKSGWITDTDLSISVAGVELTEKGKAGDNKQQESVISISDNLKAELKIVKVEP